MFQKLVCVCCVFCISRLALSEDVQPQTIPPVKTESFIGLKHIARPGYELVFNGDFNLGVAGFALWGIYTLEQGYRDDLPKIKTVLRPGNGACLQIPSFPGRFKWILLARELHLPKGTTVELSFEARAQATPGCLPVAPLYIDFRRTAQASRGNAYWIRNGSLKLTDNWTSFKKRFTTEHEDYFRIFLAAMPKQVTKNELNKPLPDIFIDSLRVKVIAPNAGWTKPQPQVAIYTDLDVPAYELGKQVQYRIRAIFPGRNRQSETVLIDLVDDQLFSVISTFRVNLNRQEDGTYSGSHDFVAARYGSYSTRVRQNGDMLFNFGGDIAVIHPAIDHPRKSIGWGIGACNYAAGYPQGLPQTGYCISRLRTGTMRRLYKVMRIAGVKVAKNWNFSWRFIESKQGQFAFNHLDEIVKMDHEFGIETMPVLGNNLRNYAGKHGKRRNVALPEWVKPQCTPHKISPAHKEEGYVPPVDLWETYCKALMQRYKNDIRVYELLNEPGAWCSGPEYMALLKASYRAAQSVSSDIMIIGPCPTGDALVSRFSEWSKEIIALGGAKYLGGFSYHPYGAGNDFQKGQYFEMTNTIESIRSWFKDKPLPLYDTECYQLSNEKFMRGDRWDASTGLRHYLITLGNGAGFCAAFQGYQLVKDRLNPHVRVIAPWVFESVPAPVSVALNNLSWLLRGMTESRVIKVNSFARTYIFSSSDSNNALGVAWDLRPRGSKWTSTAEADGLRFLDMWGNTVKTASARMLTLEPIYIIGSKLKVEQYLSRSSFRIPNPVMLTARAFNQDLYLEAKNASGMDSSPEIIIGAFPGLKFPERIGFVFAKNTHNTTLAPGALIGAMPETLPFTVLVNNEKVATGTVSMIAPTPCYTLPTGNDKPLRLDLSAGSTATFLAETGALCITVSVKDPNLVTPRRFKPWTGDAVEIFIDCAPFSRMEQDKIKAGKTRLPVWQYIVPAKPSVANELLWTTNKGTVRAIATRTLTEEGYTVTVKIPWKALQPDGNRYRVYGIDIDVDHVAEPGTPPRKEGLGAKPGASFATRLHYPLFRVPRSVNLPSGRQTFGVGEIINGSFEIKSKYGQAEGWRREYAPKMFACGPYGYNNSRGARVIKDQAADMNRGWTQHVKCEPEGNRTFLLSALIKADNVRCLNGAGYDRGIKLAVHFYDEINKKHLNNEGIGIRRNTLLGTFGWRRYQCLIPVPKDASWFQVFCGVSLGCSGTVWFDDVRIKPVQ